MEVYKVQYEKEMNAKLQEMVAAETKKMNSNKVNGVKMEGQRVPAKIQKVMAVGSPRNRGQDLKLK